MIHLNVDDGNGYIPADRGWPPEGTPMPGFKLVPLRGYVVKPGKEAAVVYTVQPPSDHGFAFAGGLQLTASVGDAHKTVALPEVGGMCIVRHGPICPKSFYTLMTDYESSQP
ncbi:MAG: hypothetical protein J2O48_06255 [Solirubrobacterales bacterium]|nr:hypothetical protein [Solirubrobacterales bacterium]